MRDTDELLILAIAFNVFPEIQALSCSAVVFQKQAVSDHGNLCGLDWGERIEPRRTTQLTAEGNNSQQLNN